MKETKIAKKLNEMLKEKGLPEMEFEELK